jgi:hypothetical protein
MVMFRLKTKSKIMRSVPLWQYLLFVNGLSTTIIPLRYSETNARQSNNYAPELNVYSHVLVNNQGSKNWGLIDLVKLNVISSRAWGITQLKSVPYIIPTEAYILTSMTAMSIGTPKGVKPHVRLKSVMNCFMFCWMRWKSAGDFLMISRLIAFGLIGITTNTGVKDRWSRGVSKPKPRLQISHNNDLYKGKRAIVKLCQALRRPRYRMAIGGIYSRSPSRKGLPADYNLFFKHIFRWAISLLTIKLMLVMRLIW